MNLRIVLGGILLSALLLLGACGGVPSKPTQPPAADDTARELLAQGDLIGAAAEYRRLAATTAPPLRESYLVEAADLLRQSGRLEEAETLLKGIRPSALPAPVAVNYRLALAALLLEQEHNEAGLEILAGLEGSRLTVEQQRRFYRLRVSLLERSRQYGQAARQRAAFDLLLSDPQAQLDNQHALWSDLGQLTGEQLRALHTQPPPDVFSGWLELALIERIFARSPEQQKSAMSVWRERFPRHPAEQGLLAEQRTLGPSAPPDHIALLLPLSGRFAAAGQAIREGFMAAYYAANGKAAETPAVTFHDTASGDVIRTYNAAVDSGAQFVVGPLTKTNLDRLLKGGPLRVPTLALNRRDTATDMDTEINRGLLFQFGLAPEDDAREAARHAWILGHRRMIALVPEGSWGTRLADAFAREWRDLGGELIETDTFTSSNVAGAVSSLLHIDKSKARRDRLSHLLGRSLEFEPHRRTDADALFLGAFPREARQIRPLLAFYYASDLPVYATSHVYSGRPNPSADQDMDGIEFCDLPWLINPTTQDQALQAVNEELWPGTSDRNTRLFALGMDAYDVIPYLRRLSQGPGFALPGRTGDLSLDPNGDLHRALSWARFDQGLPQPALPPASLSGDALSFGAPKEPASRP